VCVYTHEDLRDYTRWEERWRRWGIKKWKERRKEGMELKEYIS
jgi:hypothetical protein